MSRWMINEEKLDDSQSAVLDLPIGKSQIIKGCAGSGKTLLAVHKAREIQRKNKGSYAIIVYTRALKSFIKDAAAELGLTGKILYEWEFARDVKSAAFSKVDYLLVDESQDFSQSDITRFQSFASKGILFFGDSAQQVYDEKIDFFGDGKTKTITMEDIQNSTSISATLLTKNHRLPKNIAKVAQYLVNTGQDIVSNCSKSDGNKPILKQFATQTAEIAWILESIVNENLSSCAILVPTNDAVIALCNICKANNIDFGYKSSKDGKTEEKLDFDKQINILTYASAKGLQFSNVFLPFCDASINGYFLRNAFYVALTRAESVLYITYSNTLTPYLQSLDKNLFDVK